MGKLHNRKVVLGSRDDYTDEEWDRIPAARAQLQHAERNVREANALWKQVLRIDQPLTPLMGHRLIEQTRHVRYEAKKNLRVAYGNYVYAVMHPPAMKRLAREIGGFLRDRLRAPSFMERILPPVVVKEKQNMAYIDKKYIDMSGKAVHPRHLVKPPKQNAEGYTLVEWKNALCRDVSHFTPEQQQKLLTAWENNEDPADYRKRLDDIAHAESRPRLGTPEGEHISKLTCTKCGNTDPELFRYVESIEVYNSVVAVTNDVILIESHYESGEGYDEGKNPYFECHAMTPNECLHRTPIPDWVLKKIDWV